ncbi:RAMP superfamily CRISPR-associated protein [Acidianus sp. RZ1]|uniref:RAMP superfamily CRISPR-associated protein n=1 Tax=Acidianus sp. RZ1 TaxID=1540082 RepID=UPI001C12099C|nr:RAMP superfamily CRISPR-associated protein [Acidianus sp. RZ1]
MQKIELRFKIKNLSSLTVGGTSASATVDTPFSSLGIPGSTIKGVMRTAVSNMVSSGILKGYTSCNEIEPEMIIMKHKKMGGDCDVCKLFGYPEVEGRLFVGNIRLTKEKFKLTRVSIEDKTGKAKEGGLFSQEVIKPGEEFEGEVILDLAGLDEESKLKQVKLLLSSILALRFWRFGRGGMIDIKLEEGEKICKVIDCKNIGDLLNELGRWLYENSVS